MHDRAEARYTAIFDVDKPGYGRFLSATASAVFSLEKAVSFANPLVNWEARSRKAALGADLAELEIPLPAPYRIPVLASEAFSFGILYVLEGSRHGARQLARVALASPDPAVRSATRYLRHGQSQRLWPAFLELLETSPTVRRDPDEAARGAVAAFGAFDEAASVGHR